MNDFFKYLTVGEEDEKWGLYLNVAGKSTISSGTKYPPINHPTGYYFSWNSGRVLQEFQINYITKGGGILEVGDKQITVKPGTLMVIRKNQRHRYRPSQKTGWTENYIGFDGELANHYLDKLMVLHGKPAINCGIHEELLDTYYKIFELVQKEKPGYQQIASGLVIKLLGYMVAFQKQKTFAGKHIEQVITKARFYIRENIDSDIDLKQMAINHHTSYSYFRKMFKKYVGISPHQYYLEMKLLRAKELLLTSDKNIKEISFALGFQSEHYFSRLFKIKMGLNPSKLRQSILKK